MCASRRPSACSSPSPAARGCRRCRGCWRRPSPRGRARCRRRTPRTMRIRRTARRGCPWRLGVLLAVDRLRQQAGRRRLAGAAGPGEQVGVRDLVLRERVDQRPRDDVLSGDVGEALRAPFAIEDFGRHAGSRAMVALGYPQYRRLTGRGSIVDAGQWDGDWNDELERRSMTSTRQPLAARRRRRAGR